MRARRVSLTLAATLLAAWAASQGIEADRFFARYTIVDLGTLGGTESFAYAVNDRGRVVGTSRLAGDTTSHAFLYQSGSMTDLAPLNSGSILTAGPTAINNVGQIASGLVEDGVYVPAIHHTRSGRTTILPSLGGVTSNGFGGVATALNDLGHAVGYGYIDSSTRHAFLFEDGTITDIGSFGGDSAAMSINRHGVIVGFAADRATGVARAFVYRDGVMSEIDPFRGPNNEGYAEDVNNRGQVVGSALNRDGTAFRGFMYFRGRITTIGTLPGGRNSGAIAINDRGEVVGNADSPYDTFCDDGMGGTVPCIQYEQRAFLYRNGMVIDLNRLIPPESGWYLAWALDINARGQIVGYGLRNGKFRAYVMTPERRRGL